MTPYLVVFFLIAVGNGLTGERTRAFSQLFWVVAFFILTFFLGLRYEVGADWGAYFLSYNNVIGSPFLTSVKWQSDPLYWILNWIAANSGLGLAGLNTIIAALLVSGVMALSAQQPLRWLALTIAVPYILFIIGMGYVRQSAALGLLAFALVALGKDKPIRFIVLVLVAAMFHLSAVIFVILLPLGSPKRQWWHVPMILISTLPVAQALFIDKFSVSYARYIDIQRDSSGAAIRLAMSTPPALLALFSRRWLRMQSRDSIAWFWIALGVLMLFPLSTLSSTASDRLGVYLMLIQPVVLSRLPLAVRERLVRSALALSIISLYLLVLVVWLTRADKADFWVPYQSFLTL